MKLVTAAETGGKIVHIGHAHVIHADVQELGFLLVQRDGGFPALDVVPLRIADRPPRRSRRSRLSVGQAIGSQIQGVDEDFIEVLRKAGVTTVARLSLLEDTRAGVRKALEGEPFNIDPTQGLNRIRQVCFLDAWETATSTTTEERRQQAEAKATRLPRNVTCNEKPDFI